MPSIAKARMVHKAISHSRSFGRLSLKAKVLFLLLIAHADDQGRLPGEDDEIKWLICPNVSEIEEREISGLLKEMENQQMTKLYKANSNVIQLLQWWVYQNLQWAYPSKYPPPEGWEDKLRYKERPDKPIITRNWTLKDKMLTKEMPSQLPSQLPSQPGGLLNEEEEKTIIKRNEDDNDNEEKTVLSVPPSFFGWLENLKQSQNKVGVLIEAFKVLHSKAPSEDFEILSGRMANLFKIANKDAGYLLRIIWETAAADIAGSHLSFIQGKLRSSRSRAPPKRSLPTGDELEQSWKGV